MLDGSSVTNEDILVVVASELKKFRVKFDRTIGTLVGAATMPPWQAIRGSSVFHVCLQKQQMRSAPR